MLRAYPVKNLSLSQKYILRVQDASFKRRKGLKLESVFQPLLRGTQGTVIKALSVHGCNGSDHAPLWGVGCT